MKVLGNTKDGDIILIVSQAEYESILSDVPEVDLNELRIKRGAFVRELEKLSIDKRLRNSIMRSYTTHTIDDVEFERGLEKNNLFIKDGQVLSFGEWAKYVFESEEYFYRCQSGYKDRLPIRNMSKKAVPELKRALIEAGYIDNATS